MSNSGPAMPKLRNARACEACRVSKSKCLFQNQQNICNRCESTGNQCIVRTKSRPMRTKSARREGTSTIDQLSKVTQSEFSIELPTITATDSSANCEELLQHHKEIFADEESHRAEPGGQTRSSPLLIEQRTIDKKQAEQLLLAFWNKVHFFPFVQILPEDTIPSLSRSSPFLLLAILTVASFPDPRLHHQLDYEFRRVLSSEVIVQGQKSLDFIQGLLVYIAWYPLHSKPKNNQAFIYMNIAISIAIELGLDQELPKMNVFSTTNTKGLVENSLFTTAAKKAYLGCYYLSSALSIGFQKPSDLHFPNLMKDDGGALFLDESLGQFGPDEIVSLVKLQHLTERIGKIHKSKSPAMNGDENMSLIAEVNIQICLKELQEWKMDTSHEIKSLPLVGLAVRFANITVYSHQLGFLLRPYRYYLKLTETYSTPNQSHLFSCLDACKQFFEYLISIPEYSYTNFTIVQWTSVVQAVLVLSRLTFLMASNLGWTPETTRKNVPLVMYLDALCYRFQAISSTPTPPGSERPKDPDVFYIFKLILSSVKKSYLHRVAAITPKSFESEMGKAVPIGMGHCPMTDPTLSVYFDSDLEMSGSTYWRSGDFNEGGSLVNTSAAPAAPVTPVYFDLWATMTGSWTEEFDHFNVA